MWSWSSGSCCNCSFAKSNKNFCSDGWCPGQDLNQISSKYISELLLVWPTHLYQFFFIYLHTFVCEMYRNLLLAGFDNVQWYYAIKCQQSTLLERYLLKVLHVSVWATIFEVEMSTNWRLLMCNIKCFVCNCIYQRSSCLRSGVQWYSIWYTIKGY
jgi:hypothetical protein